MKKITILLFTTFLCLNVILKSQTLHDNDMKLNIENAEYVKEDLTKLLQSNMTYPLEALKNEIQGDVILSFLIDKTGNLDSLNILISPNDILSASSIVSFNHLENEWSPCKVNGDPIDKKYFIVFRYRLYMNTQPPEYIKRAEKFVEKQKYEKALKFYDKAIAENLYDSRLFELRSKVKEILGDKDGAEKDFQESKRLQNEIISLVDIEAIGISRVEKRVVY